MNKLLFGLFTIACLPSMAQSMSAEPAIADTVKRQSLMIAPVPKVFLNVQPKLTPNKTIRTLGWIGLGLMALTPSITRQNSELGQGVFLTGVAMGPTALALAIRNRKLQRQVRGVAFR